MAKEKRSSHVLSACQMRGEALSKTKYLSHYHNVDIHDYLNTLPDGHVDGILRIVLSYRSVASGNSVCTESIITYALEQIASVL